MKRLSLAAFLFCLFAPSLVAAKDDAKLDAPPAGLQPTTVHLKEILTLHTAMRAPKSAIEEWSFTDTGAKGTEHLERSGEDYFSRFTIGPVVEEYGQLLGKRWRRDANGNVLIDTAPEEYSFVGSRVVEAASDAKNDVSVAGITADAHPSYVLRVKLPHNAHPQWMYFDTQTGNVTRVDLVNNGKRLIQTYSDFRTVNGYTRPWHVHDSYEDHVLDDDYQLTTFTPDVPIDARQFRAPESHDTAVSKLTTRTMLPVKMTRSGGVIVRLNVNGRGLDFALNSASMKSVIDRDVAREIGLQSYGEATSFSDGSPRAYQSILPDADAGQLHLHNFALDVREISYQPDLSTRVVGMLGYDFIASHVFKIDYVNRSVEVIPPELFRGPIEVQEAQDIPVHVRGGLFFVPMIVGSGFTDDALVSDDSFITFVFGQYVEAHSDDFQSVSGTQKREGAIPFADGESFGQRLTFTLDRTSSLRFANADIANHMVITTNFPATGIDAMLGVDYLHYFDVYFDAPHQRFIVAPNKWFHETFKPSK